MEFGAPVADIEEPDTQGHTSSEKTAGKGGGHKAAVRGEWHLWIFCCEWAVYRDTRMIGDWSDEEARVQSARALEGGILTETLFAPSEGTSIFMFSDSMSLVTKPYDRESEQWLLYEPSGKVLTYRYDGMFNHQPGDEPDTDHWVAPEDISR